MTAPNEATLNQIEAADPTRSTWLTANAGSGKTKVLTDRVTRLLLNGVDPECVLCLTYTKAAAAEMQNRLFKRLAEWAMMPDAKLLDALRETGVAGEPDIGHARTLFARAIETPGGIKIQTIHAFCSMLLRRFPLEAGVSPGFRELDEAEATRLRHDIVDQMAEHGAPEIDAVATYLSTDDIGEFSAAVAGAARHFPPDLDRQRLADCMGIPADLTPESLLREFLGSDSGPTLSALKAALAEARSGSNDEKALRKIVGLDPENVTPADHAKLEGLFLTGESAKSGAYAAKIGSFPTKDSRARMGPGAVEALNGMMARAERLREPRLALAALEKADALRRFAQAFLPAYEAAKMRRGALDFADLISRASRLLSDRSVAEWVLYRIDGTIDHILVDEAQDTSPGQWEVIEKLAAEMTAGQGSRPDTPRTLFVVGDLKQSIYSFQGADPRVMDEKRSEFQARLEGGAGLANRKLLHSFRSARAILDVVDRTFTGPRAQGLGDAVDHAAFHETMPGRVDLWPLETPSEAADKAAWYDPVDRVLETDPQARLARRIASEIKRWVERETIPAKKGKFRPVTENDVLILVQGRSALFHQIIRACKAAGLTVAGADRLRIQSELAARDIMAALAFLALPEDDLALATVLRSPLFGWSESELFELAQPRKGYLWTALRNSGATRTLAILHDLLDQSDFLRPFELIERLLTRHGGRARLLARLGAEAEEGIDALLNEAMRYEQSGPPSLSGFVAWYAGQETDIKRQTAGAGAGIRVMTVHGAKGLESPIVILPDTLRDGRERQQTILPTEDGVPLWAAARAERPAALAAAARRKKDADEEERRRLLYVAMTRAESWLVVAGAGEAPKKGETWYEAVSDGLDAAHGAPATLSDGTKISRYETGDWSGPVSEPEAQSAVSPVFPAWVDGPDRAPPKRVRALSPSDLGGEKALSDEPPAGAAHGDPLAYGTRLHLLLEHLPGLPRGQREAAARALLPEVPASERAALLAEAVRLLEAPDLGEVFGPESLAEVAFACELNGQPLQGTIDRLLVSDEAVLAVDFKSNRAVPDRPDSVPEGLLRQMGAYAHALTQIYPGKTVETAIVWTSTATLMRLPDDIVRQALARSATS